MPHFSYKAIGRDGKSLDGTIEADGLELATRQLRGQGLTLLKLEAGGAAAAATAGKMSGKPPGRQEILSMTSELAVLLRAGLPLDHRRQRR
jgi:general secretion pathway protein F